MIELFKNVLFDWNNDKNQRSKLQQAYFAIIIVLAMFAGVITLFSPSVGQHIMIIAAGFAGVYVVNGVVWTLLEGIVIRRLDTIKRTTNRKK